MDLHSLRDSQESSPAPQFKRVSSLVLSLPYGPRVTSIHNYWENQSFDYVHILVEGLKTLNFKMF